jgi:hypothetical protein
VAKQLTLLYDYFEDIASSALGIAQMIPFFQQCFHSQSYQFVTGPNAAEFWREL